VELLKIDAARSDRNDLISQRMETLRNRLGSAMRIAEELAGTPASPGSGNAVDERYIRNLLKLRRSRDRFFADGLFADPAWDILLELYGAALGQYRVSVSNLCHGAAVPATTGLRWIKQLEEEGLIGRRPDPTDGRRQFLELSGKGFEAMNGYFGSIRAGSQVI
jgi:DNA-binding MarR family transcriptional regulator